MPKQNLLTDASAIKMLGERVSRQRLQRNQTQAELATASGVSKRTVERLEAGESTQLSNFIRILRALDLLDGLDVLIPEIPPSPIEQLKLQGRQRQRASSARQSEVPPTAWAWKDEA
ncbi:MAG TPA: helix-turn-helix transcriptional regulator [Dokdonella sp.]|uniref:helix-turn-helix transcriptional regulator n=1 Tax=Dokdonella sp. TaxID=2291710 RepID=UPI002D7EBAEB|nr:helix-turn-helix transcriptional regulator [Dokdonella sp.]HET9031688.1 helix-turn-helix transcriptional regulator [Dokdonella sp.]